MKKPTLILCLLSALALMSCGSNDDASVAGEGTAARREEVGFISISQAPRRRFATISGGKEGAKPRIDPADLPLPKVALARDLEVGDGPVAHRGVTAGVYYFSVDYKTGRSQFHRWPPAKPLIVEFDGPEDAWEEGIEGMKVGGRREILLPWTRTDVTDYVVDLVWVKTNSEADGETDSAGG